LSEEEREEWEK